MLRLAEVPLHILRGMGRLPHVGEHPGTGMMLIFLLMGFAAGFKSGGMAGAVFAGLGVSLVMFPLYACGAYDRARFSDRRTRREELESLLTAWLSIESDHPGRKTIVCIFYLPDEDRVVLRIDPGPKNGYTQKDIPAWLCEAVREILTRPRAGRAPHRPDKKDLAAISVRPAALSSHARMEALQIIHKTGGPVTAS